MDVVKMPPVARGEPRTLIDERYGPHLYTLDEDGIPVGTFDTQGWARWMDGSESRREESRYWSHTLTNGLRVTTIFLGIDQGFGTVGNIGPPLLWQTVIVEDNRVRWETLYSRLDDARRGHADALELATELNPRKDQ